LSEFDPIPADLAKSLGGDGASPPTIFASAPAVAVAIVIAVAIAVAVAVAVALSLLRQRAHLSLQPVQLLLQHHKPSQPTRTMRRRRWRGSR